MKAETFWWSAWSDAELKKRLLEDDALWEELKGVIKLRRPHVYYVVKAERERKLEEHGRG